MLAQLSVFSQAGTFLWCFFYTSNSDAQATLANKVTSLRVTFASRNNLMLEKTTVLILRISEAIQV